MPESSPRDWWSPLEKLMAEKAFSLKKSAKLLEITLHRLNRLFPDFKKKNLWKYEKTGFQKIDPGIILFLFCF
jgi:hypothetical protein